MACLFIIRPLLVVLLFCMQYASTTVEPVQQDNSIEPFLCDCDLENKLHFVNLLSRVKEHSVPTTYIIDVRIICDSSCVVFGRLPSTPDYVYQGNWSIDRDGTIRFDHRLHKTGVAMLNITVEEVSGSSNYTAHTAYRVAIEEDPDWPIVFASQAGLAIQLDDFDDTRDQFKNVTLSVEQNTGNNTEYADLLFTVGAFDYDADESIRVEVLAAEEQPRLGQLVDGLNASSSAQLLEPQDCDLEDSEQRLRNRSLSEWDVTLPVWYPCNLSLPYAADELSWFANLVRYRPGLRQSGLDRFVLTYTDKYRLQGRLHVHVHILQNPCVNGGRCWGPSWDPDCASTVRSSGFFNHGYLCQCESGWVGDRCEIDFDDCSSSPCPSPFVCVDKFRGYECVCPENLARCQPILTHWQLSATILGIVAGVCLVAAVLILASQRAPVVMSLSKPSSKQAPAPAAAPEPDEAPPDAFKEGDIDLAEPALMEPPTITFTEAEVQADPSELAGEAASETPTPAATPLPRPPKPQLGDGYRQSFHRGSILIPRSRPEAWRSQPMETPFFEGSRDGASTASGDANEGEVIARGGGAGSPSDAWRLQELRRAVRNRHAIDDF